MPALPTETVQHLRARFGDAGQQFLERLPDDVARAADRWSITAMRALPGSLTGAVFAGVADGRDVVCKFGIDPVQLRREVRTLQHWEPTATAATVIARADSCYLMARVLPGHPWVGRDEDFIEQLACLRDCPPPPADLAEELPTGHQALATRLVARQQAMVAREDCPLTDTDFEWAVAQLADLPECTTHICHGDLHSRGALTGPSGLPVLIDPIPVLADPAYDAGYWAASHNPERTRSRVTALCAKFPADAEYLTAISRIAAVQEVCAQVKYRVAPHVIPAAMAWIRADQ